MPYEIKTYETINNQAHINGSKGKYGNSQKGAVYGKNAAANHFGYIKSLASTGLPAPKPDIFTKSGSIDSMEKEAAKLQKEPMPPVNFTLRYSPKYNALKAFFARLFTGSAIDKQALLGFSFEAMGGKKSISVEEADAAFKNEAFKDINAKLTTKAFDVNNDGQIDISEEAVSTVVADALSKDDSTGLNGIDLKKTDGSYTNKGEDKMMAFCNEENLETASKVAKTIHKKMKLDKALNKF